MKVIRADDFTQEFKVDIALHRRLGNQEIFNLPTVYAANFIGNKKHVFPMRYLDEDECIGLAYFLDMPFDYFYKPYRIYRLKKKYRLVNGDTKVALSYCFPIPSKMLVDVGASKRGPKKHLSVKGGFLRDGRKVILVQRYNPSEESA